MVSRKFKRTPTKSIKKINRRRNKHTPTKSALITCLNKSLSTAHRRLLKIFSNLTQTLHNKITTPPTHNNNNYYSYYQLLPKIPPLPPPTKNKTIFLDLDETLIHSTPEIPPPHYDFVVTPLIDNIRCNFYVLKRPHLDHFLRSLAPRFELVIFTAGIQEYAKLVIDKICANDGMPIISHRLYRDSCREIEGKYVKDLGEMGRDLRNVVIVDDNPNSYMLQPGNGVGILPFTDDVEDGELRKLVEFFGGIDDDKCEDLRDAVKCFNSNKCGGNL